jgi:type VI secretion system protein ImpB
LKGPLGNIAEFRKSLQGLITSDESREQLLAELSLINESNSDEASHPSE